MRESTPRKTEVVQGTPEGDARRIAKGLPGSLLTAFDVPGLVGCHEESVRHAYLCGQPKRQRFGVRSGRFRPADVEDWIGRGAPTTIS